MTKILCDFCKKEKFCFPLDIPITNHNTIEQITYRGKLVPFRMVERDCCESCSKKIIKYFENLIGEE